MNARPRHRKLYTTPGRGRNILHGDSPQDAPWREDADPALKRKVRAAAAAIRAEAGGRDCGGCRFLVWNGVGDCLANRSVEDYGKRLLYVLTPRAPACGKWEAR